VFEPVPHVLREPAQLPAAGQQPVPQLGVPPAVADEPLPAGDDLQRRVALLVELDRVGDRRRLADQAAGLAQQPDDLAPGRVDAQPREALIGRCRHAFRPVRQEPPVAAQHHPGLEVEVAPPGDVGQITEGADHRDAGALVRRGQRMLPDRHFNIEERRSHGTAEQVPVALVAGMEHQRDAGRQQLGPGGVDVDGSVRAVEAQLVVRPLAVPVLQLGLRHRGAETNIPERGGLRRVRLAARQIAQEGALRDGLRPLADRGVGQSPVDGQPEPPPQRLEDLFILGGQPPAQLDEVTPGDRDRILRRGGRRLPVRVVGQRRIAPDAVDVLHPALGGQPVVVPAHRVEDGAAAHPLEPRDGIGVRVGEDVPHVQLARYGRRRGVDRVYVRALLGTVERVRALLLPPVRPPLLEPVQRRPLGETGARGPTRISHALNATAAACFPASDKPRAGPNVAAPGATGRVPARGCAPERRRQTAALRRRTEP
jgi:hypothetical protein